MTITPEQAMALEQGEAVPVEVDGRACVLLDKAAYERLRDQTPDEGEWTREERDLLASEAADMLAGDGFDYPDDES